MQAAVVSTPGRIEIQPVGRPEPGPYEALVKIEACGLCGTTDRHIIAGTQCHHPAAAYPAVLGHEAVGTVVAVGGQVRNFQVGDRVTRPVAVWPGEIRNGLHSAWGGFAQYGIVRDRAALIEAGHSAYHDDYTAQRQQVVPAGLSALDATLAISLAEVASWIWKLGPLGGRSLAVGGTGFAACAMCFFAKLAGTGPVIALGRRASRLDHAVRCGADFGVSLSNENAVEETRRLAGGDGAHFFAEATGADQVFQTGLRMLAPGGVAAIYGAPDEARYTLMLRGSPGDFSARLISPEDHVAFPWVCRLIAEGRLDPALFRSHTWHGLDSIHDALAAQEKGDVIKGFITLDGSPE